jgi:hypothetical protein
MDDTMTKYRKKREFNYISLIGEGLDQGYVTAHDLELITSYHDVFGGNANQLLNEKLFGGEVIPRHHASRKRKRR